MKLQTRLTLSFLLIVAVLLGTVSWVLHQRLQDQFQRQFGDTVAQAEETVVKQILRDAQALEKVLKRVQEDTRIKRV
ncbi:MAG TPA: hypothetical protein EYN66_10170 [Myxococcales bacterium]|nr:hypothetical protein [Myxococcales bacterium]